MAKGKIGIEVNHELSFWLNNSTLTVITAAAIAAGVPVERANILQDTDIYTFSWTDEVEVDAEGDW